jgi:hypothetical protein
MPHFPSDFLEPDGRFRDLLPGDFVPILYVMEDGSRVCAVCVNGMRDLVLRGIVPCAAAHDPSWRLTGYDLHYEGPPVGCAHCDATIEALYGDPDAPESG